jgi:RNA polymerase sigma-70 factor (ECF subfamily)
MLHGLHGDEGARRNALEKLVRRYWGAIYAYIRRTGRDVHEASDLTQGFIATVVLERNLGERADRARGRFRSLLLASLRNYLHERHRHETRRKRSAGEGEAVIRPFDIDAVEGRDYETPEAAFSYHWAAALVRAVLEKVRQGCLRDGLEMHWAVFDARVARPLLFGEQPASIAELIEQFELPSSAQASNMLITVKRRFVRALRAEIAGTVNSGNEVEDELIELMKDLERRRKVER